MPRLRRTSHILNRTNPDYVMTMHDHTGLNRIVTDLRLRHAHGHIAAEGRTVPARNARRFICVEITGRRGIGHENKPDVSKTIDRHKRIPPGARVPAGNAHEVPHQPRPEERPDMGKVALKVRMHAPKRMGRANRADKAPLFKRPSQ